MNEICPACGTNYANEMWACDSAGRLRWAISIAGTKESTTKHGCW